MIKCVDLTKNYGTARGVRGLTFEARPGEVLGFLGPNGAGKTTAIKLLTGYFPPVSGEAWIAGRSVAREPLRARAAVGYLPENAPVYPNMSVAGYVDFMLCLKRPLMGRRERREEVARALEAARLTERAGQRIADLSKGLRQRAGLAQAIAGDPEVVILDEPQNGLDPSQARSARELIRGLARSGKTVMLSTHILSEVEALADKVVIINEGRIVAQGKPSELEGDSGGAPVFDLEIQSPTTAPADKLRDLLLDGKKSGLPKGWKALEAAGGEGAPASLALRWKGSGEPDAVPLAKACGKLGWRALSIRARRPSLEEAFLRAIKSSSAKNGQSAG